MPLYVPVQDFRDSPPRLARSYNSWKAKKDLRQAGMKRIAGDIASAKDKGRELAPDYYQESLIAQAEKAVADGKPFAKSLFMAENKGGGIKNRHDIQAQMLAGQFLHKQQAAIANNKTLSVDDFINGYVRTELPEQPFEITGSNPIHQNVLDRMREHLHHADLAKELLGKKAALGETLSANSATIQKKLDQLGDRREALDKNIIPHLQTVWSKHADSLPAAYANAAPGLTEKGISNAIVFSQLENSISQRVMNPSNKEGYSAEELQNAGFVPPSKEALQEANKVIANLKHNNDPWFEDHLRHARELIDRQREYNAVYEKEDDFKKLQAPMENAKNELEGLSTELGKIPEQPETVDDFQALDQIESDTKKALEGIFKQDPTLSPEDQKKAPPFKGLGELQAMLAIAKNKYTNAEGQAQNGLPAPNQAINAFNPRIQPLIEQINKELKSIEEFDKAIRNSPKSAALHQEFEQRKGRLNRLLGELSDLVKTNRTVLDQKDPTWLKSLDQATQLYRAQVRGNSIRIPTEAEVTAGLAPAGIQIYDNSFWGSTTFSTTDDRGNKLTPSNNDQKEAMQLLRQRFPQYASGVKTERAIPALQGLATIGSGLILGCLFPPLGLLVAGWGVYQTIEDVASGGDTIFPPGGRDKYLEILAEVTKKNAAPQSTKPTQSAVEATQQEGEAQGNNKPAAIEATPGSDNGDQTDGESQASSPSPGLGLGGG